MQLLALAASVLGIEVDELLAHFKKNAMAWAAVALFALIGLAFLLVALNAWFTAMWGPILAPLFIGAGAILVALGFYVVIAVTEGTARRHAAQRRNSAEKTALVTTAALSALPLVLKSDLMRKVGIPIGGALAAAYMLSRNGSSHGHTNGHDAD